MQKILIVMCLLFSANLFASNINLYGLEVKSLTYEFSKEAKAHAYITGQINKENCAFYISFEDLASEKLSVLKEALKSKVKINLQFAFLYDQTNNRPAAYTATSFIEAITQHFRENDSQSAMFTFAPKMNENYITFIKVIN